MVLRYRSYLSPPISTRTLWFTPEKRRSKPFRKEDASPAFLAAHGTADGDTGSVTLGSSKRRPPRLVLVGRIDLPGLSFPAPPFQTNDEPGHWYRAWTVSQGDLQCKRMPKAAEDLLGVTDWEQIRAHQHRWTLKRLEDLPNHGVLLRISAPTACASTLPFPTFYRHSPSN